MQINKKDIYQFLTWMRNGTAFSVTWFLVLLLIYNSIFKVQSVSTCGLWKLLLLCMGGVFLFNVCFTKLFIKKWTFMPRLSCFMGVFMVYECWGFYLLGIFQSFGTVKNWIIFFAIVCILYLCCVVIYLRYSKKQGELYTLSLQKYQEKRRAEHVS